MLTYGHRDAIHQTADEHIDEIDSLSKVYMMRNYIRDKYHVMPTSILTALDESADEHRVMLQIILVLTILKQGGLLTIKIKDPIYNIERYLLDRLTASFLSTRWLNEEYLICDHYLGYNELLINKLSRMYAKYNPFYGRKKLNF
jgi:hypothetical protein